MNLALERKMKIARKLIRIAGELDNLGLHDLADEIDELSDEDGRTDDDKIIANMIREQHERAGTEEDLVWDIAHGLRAELGSAIGAVFNELHGAGFLLIKLVDGTKIFVHAGKHHDYDADFDHSKIAFDIDVENPDRGIEKRLNFALPRNELRNAPYQRHIGEIVDRVMQLL